MAGRRPWRRVVRLVVHRLACYLGRWAIVYLAQMKPLINPILSGE